MQCRDCQQMLTADEQQQHQVTQHALDDFEASLHPSEGALAPLVIADSVTAALDAEAAEGDDALHVPAWWGLPQCARCQLQDRIDNVTSASGSEDDAFIVMRAYAQGRDGALHAPVLAHGWALVVQQCYTCNTERAAAPQYQAAGLLLAEGARRLTADDQQQAAALAQQIMEAATQAGALWVPTPRADVLAYWRRHGLDL